jgi:hypothetical protein
MIGLTVRIFGSVARKGLKVMARAPSKLRSQLGARGVNEWPATVAAAEKMTLPLRCMEKSAEVIEEKGFASAPLRERVRK